VFSKVFTVTSETRRVPVLDSKKISDGRRALCGRFEAFSNGSKAIESGNVGGFVALGLLSALVWFNVARQSIF
jgi:hypothetical protein